MKISDIARRVKRQRARRPRVRAVLDDILPPVPTTRAAPGRLYPGPAIVIDLSEARARRSPRLRRPPASPATRLGILAALTVAAALSALLMALFEPEGIVRYADGRLIARGELGSALNEQLTGQAAAGAHILLTASWRTRGGDICRNFSVAGSQTLSGTACREGRQWQIQSLNGAGSNAPAASASGHSPALAPLSNAAEMQLRARGWQSS